MLPQSQRLIWFSARVFCWWHHDALEHLNGLWSPFEHFPGNDFLNFRLCRVRQGFSKWGRGVEGEVAGNAHSCLRHPESMTFPTVRASRYFSSVWVSFSLFSHRENTVSWALVRQSPYDCFSLEVISLSAYLLLVPFRDLPDLRSSRSEISPWSPSCCQFLSLVLDAVWKKAETAGSFRSALRSGPVKVLALGTVSLFVDRHTRHVDAAAMRWHWVRCFILLFFLFFLHFFSFSNFT